MSFDLQSFFPEGLYRQVTKTRVFEPETVLVEAWRRKRRTRLAPDGRLVILAADHPGRGVTGAGGNRLAMGDRYELLARILRVLTRPGVDGVMATADVLEELLILSALTRKPEGPGLLDEKVLMGCMNRGGLSGTAFEMDDRFGALTARQIHRMRYDAAKMMFRLDPENPQSGSTIHACAVALRELEALDLPAFLEPLPVEQPDGAYKVVKSAEALARVVGIATALGNSSRLLWLKIPYVEGYRAVARATTCPILMLGGETRDQPLSLLSDFEAGMKAGETVRGALVGRNVLFPGAWDPGAMAEAVARVVHHSMAAAEASSLLESPPPCPPLTQTG